MSEPVPLAVVRAWQRRADTIHRRVQDLNDALLRRLGEEHSLTDFADNLLMASEELGDALINAAKYPQLRKDQSHAY
jgi:hypothetical protein